MENIRLEILKALPTNRREALCKDELCEALDISKHTLSRLLKEIRSSGIPILWWSRGIYIDYAPGAINKQIKMIENMKEGFVEGMAHIQHVYTGVNNNEYEIPEVLRNRI